MNKVIEQIKEINGVETVELTDKGFTGTFNTEKPIVKCETKEQFGFVGKMFGLEESKWLAKSYCAGRESDCVNIASGMYGSHGYYKEEGLYIISFSQYLTDYNLTDKWRKYYIDLLVKKYPNGTKFKSACSGNEKTVNNIDSIQWLTSENGNEGFDVDNDGWLVYGGKWAEIVKEELVLVPGEIYRMDGNSSKIFRFKSMEGRLIKRYSTLYCRHDKKFYSNIGGHFHKSGDIKPATKKQKKKLIKAEFKNKFYWELESKKK